MSNQPRPHGQPDGALATEDEKLRREEMLLDHHIEELLDAIGAVDDLPTMPAWTSDTRR